LDVDDSHEDVADDDEAPAITTNEEMTFVCPKCKRSFADWASCHTHMTVRGHNQSSSGSRCIYSLSSPSLPVCGSEHALLPKDGNSGWCDTVGRRKRQEDSHTLFFGENYVLYGVFDGHLGSRASRWCAKFLPTILDKIIQQRAALQQQQQQQQQEDEQQSKTLAQNLQGPLEGQKGRLRSLNEESVFAALQFAAPEDELVGGESGFTARDAAEALSLAFERAQSSFLTQHRREVSGTTAAVAVLFSEIAQPSHLLVGNVGDSRILMVTRAGTVAVLSADHTPKDPREAARVLQSGGFIAHNRVNGQLAVTRAIGDAPQSSLLSASPDVLVLRLGDEPAVSPNGSSLRCRELVETLGALEGSAPTQPLFLILASDGVFDVLSNVEAGDIVCEHLANQLRNRQHQRQQQQQQQEQQQQQNAAGGVLQYAARALVAEAYVRGSTDNIGAALVALGGLGSH